MVTVISRELVKGCTYPISPSNEAMAGVVFLVKDS